MLRHTGMVLALGSILALGSAMPPAWAHGTTERVSVGPGGVEGNGDSDGSAISANGRFVAFLSSANDLVPDDTNAQQDVFVRDRLTGTTRRVSVGPDGVQGNEGSGGWVLSPDGRFVAFNSFATNLVPGDTNESLDVFVHNLQTGRTKRVSLRSNGAEGNGSSFNAAISADGRFVAFESFATNLVKSDTNNSPDVFVRDRLTGTTQRVSVGPGGLQSDGQSSFPALSADGRFVAFHSAATNLVPGDTNGTWDVFVRDRQTGTTGRVSVRTGGVEVIGDSDAAALSADGRFVSFESMAGNLVPGDTNGESDIFVHDRKTGSTRRVSMGSGGMQANGASFVSSLSADGRIVAFVSFATNLVPGDTNGAIDVFVRDLRTHATRRVSRGSSGVQGNGDSQIAAISANGRFVSFSSDASNLVPGDTNAWRDVFVRILTP